MYHCDFLGKRLQESSISGIIIKIFVYVEQGAVMAEPKYRLEGIVHTRSEAMEDFEGPLDVIFLLLSKNKI